MRPPVRTGSTLAPHAELAAAEADLTAARARRGGLSWAGADDEERMALAPPVDAAPSPREAQVKDAITALVVDMLRDPRTRDSLLAAADQSREAAVGTGRAIASGIRRVSPHLLAAIESFAKRKTGGCDCGHAHRGATNLAARMQTIDEARSGGWGGKRKADVADVWKIMSDKFYAEGDMPVLAVRECLQNSMDALSERSQWFLDNGTAPKFAVELRGTTLSIEDNGIGMAPPEYDPERAAGKLPPRLDKFITLGGSLKSGEAFGGFGVAKAIILGTGQEGWKVETGHVVMQAPSSNPDFEFDVARAPRFRQGVKVTLFGVKTDERTSPYTTGNYEDPDERILGLLRLNKIPGVEITFNGTPVEYRYDGYRSISNPEWTALQWSGHDDGHGKPACVGTVRSYERDGGRSTRIIYRLKRTTAWGDAWLVQHAEMLWREVPRDIFLDLKISRYVSPKDAAYPLRGSRDGFIDRTAIASLRKIQDDLSDEEKAKEMAKKEEREKAEWEDIHPDSTDAEERRGAAAVDDAIEAAMAGMQDDLQEILAAMDKYRNDPSQFSPDEDEAGADDGGGTEIEQPSEASAFEAILETASDTQHEGPVNAARVVNALADAAGVTLSGDVQTVLSAMSRGDTPTAAETVEVLGAVGEIDDALAEAAGEGAAPSATWAQAPAVAAVVDLVSRVSAEPKNTEVRKAKNKINPFGNRAFIRISRRMPEDVVTKFKKGFKKYVPLLAIWDSTLRIVAHAARQKKPFQPGFILEGGTRGYCCTTEGANGKVRVFVCINPLLWDTYVELYPKRADLLARYLYEIACHEVAHIDFLGSGEEHGTDWARSREDIGFSAASAIPLITTMTARILKLKDPGKGRKGGDRAESKRTRAELDRLRAELDKAHTEHGKMSAEVLRMRALVQNGGASYMHQLLTRLDQHERIVAFCGWLRRMPEHKRPLGMTTAGWLAFIDRLAVNPAVALKLMEAGGYLEAVPTHDET